MSWSRAFARDIFWKGRSQLNAGVRQNGEHPLPAERREYVRYICVCK